MKLNIEKVLPLEEQHKPHLKTEQQHHLKSKQAGNGPSRHHAPFLRLKNSKKTSKCLKYSLLHYTKNPKIGPNCCTRGDAFFEKSLKMPKKLKEETLWDFSSSFLSQNSKKIEGGPFGKIFFSKKKSDNAEKTGRDSL